METKVRSIKEIFLTSSPLQVPIYQRDYSWGIKQWEQVWIDLINCIKKNKKSYFFGNIILEETGNKAFIIDGQQRLITLALLLKALSFKKGWIQIITWKKPLLKNFVKKIGMNLKLNKKDNEVFQNIIKSKEVDIAINKISAIKECYKFFLKKIEKINKISKHLTADHLFKNIIDFTVSIIYVDAKDKPQQIFERLNAASLSLTEADLIRNYVLMNLDPSKQKEFYQKYWQKIEKLVDNLESFIWHFTITESKTWIKQKEITIKFKKLFQNIFENENKREEMGKRMLRLANFYSYIIQKKKHKNKKINIALQRLKKTNLTIHYPYLMSVFDIINETSVLIRIIKIIEGLCFRRICIGKTPNSLTRFFASLNKRIIKILNNLANEDKREYKVTKKYVDVLIAILTDKKTNLFPTNDEFRKVLIKTNLRKDKKMRLELFKFMINFKETSSLNDKKLNIRYIMPKKLTDKWKEHLGNNYEDIHDRYLDRLGNLTVTDKKSNPSDKIIGKNISLPFINTELIIHSWFKKINVWNKNEIEKHGTFLAKLLIKVWPFPKSNIVLTNGKKISKKKKLPSKKRKKYSINWHLIDKKKNIKQIFSELRREILLLDEEGITEISQKKSIAYGLFNQTFISIVVLKTKVKIFFNIKKNNIDWNDPHAMIEDFTEKGKWCGGDYGVTINEIDDVNKIMILIRQCYNYFK